LYKKIVEKFKSF